MAMPLVLRATITGNHDQLSSNFFTPCYYNYSVRLKDFANRGQNELQVQGLWKRHFKISKAKKKIYLFRNFTSEPDGRNKLPVLSLPARVIQFLLKKKRKKRERERK